MKIRKAKPEDVEGLLPLAAALATSFTVERRAFRKSFGRCLREESSILLVAEDKERLVGYLLGFDHFAFFANGRVSGVEEIYVSPSHRRRGIGKRLMNEFERWAKSRGSAQVVVCTRRASEFYSSIGYEETAACFRFVLKKDAKQTHTGNAAGPPI